MSMKTSEMRIGRSQATRWSAVLAALGFLLLPAQTGASAAASAGSAGAVASVPRA
jgi:hypothetical protein